MQAAFFVSVQPGRIQYPRLKALFYGKLKRHSNPFTEAFLHFIQVLFNDLKILSFSDLGAPGICYAR